MPNFLMYAVAVFDKRITFSFLRNHLSIVCIDVHTPTITCDADICILQILMESVQGIPTHLTFSQPMLVSNQRSTEVLGIAYSTPISETLRETARTLIELGVVPRRP